MKCRLACLLIFMANCFALLQPASAHPLAPALLELEQTGPATYNVLWRVSALQSSGSRSEPVLPARCPNLNEPGITVENGGAIAARWQINCGTGSLAGEVIAVTDLARSGINVILRIRDPHGGVTQTLLDAATPSFTLPSAIEHMPVMQRYLELGIEHLLFGLDHLLFVLGLMLLVRVPVKIALTLTAFTLGHSITLSMAALGVIAVPQALMELGIALSLVVLARELLSEIPSLLGRKPGIMAFTFGLLHGLGFAGALGQIGLPQTDILHALLVFNIGIELGQLGIVCVTLLVIYLSKELRHRIMNNVGWQSAFATTLPAYFIGALAALWCIERLEVL